MYTLIFILNGGEQLAFINKETLMCSVWLCGWGYENDSLNLNFIQQSTFAIDYIS